MRLLILRPAPGNAATARKAAALGFEPVCVPLFEVAAIAWDPPDPAHFTAVAMTSASAARCAGPALARYLHLPLFAVGEATADAARAAGFGDVVAGPADAHALSELIARQAGGPVLHLAGADHRPLALPRCTTVTVYAAREREPREDERAALTAARLALVHSPRAGTRLAEIMPGRRLTLVAISAATAAACGPGWLRVAVAASPTDDAMLALARQLCDDARE